MNLLAIDTSTETLSVAVCRTVQGQPTVWQHTGPGAAQASTGLIAAVMDLMAQAGLALSELDALCFGSGPGSFTGLRTACSVAQGLAFGAQVPVLPVCTLLAVAEEARHNTLPQVAHCQVAALLDARMDELYAAHYAWADGQWRTVQAPILVAPQDWRWQPEPDRPALVAGNVFALYGERLVAAQAVPNGSLDGAPANTPHSTNTPVSAPRVNALPQASAMLRLAPALLAAGHAVPADQALPLYIRDKVAKTTQERMAEKAAALGVQA
jgi:tRNA threonylcarbamoyladenosine biosynthesis protein TsaB